MRCDIISIFPQYLEPLSLSLPGQAQRNGLLDVHVHDLRDFAHDRHRSVDDTPYGGGAGMVMKPQPWWEALEHVKGQCDGVPTLIVPGPGGEVLTQRLARELSEQEWLVFACGRYEGIDERVYEAAAEAMPVRVISLGDYVLNGGEVAVLAMIEATARLLPGFMGNAESLVEESHEDGLLEYPVYTKPAVWRGREVPSVLLSGDHAKVATWRHQQRLDRTAARRPDLLHASAALRASEVEPTLMTPADTGERLTLALACGVVEDVGETGWTGWGIRYEGRLVASVETRPAPGQEKIWQIRSLCVAPDLQGRGIGLAMLNFAESTAPSEFHQYEFVPTQGPQAYARVLRRAKYKVRASGDSTLERLLKFRRGA